MAVEKILVVDDEEDLLELIGYNLGKEGYRVTCVASGEEAIHEAKQSLPDLVLLDLLLPSVDGLDVCKALKGDPKTQHIPIIMLTAKSEEADVVTGLGAWGRRLSDQALQPARAAGPHSRHSAAQGQADRRRSAAPSASTIS